MYRWSANAWCHYIQYSTAIEVWKNWEVTVAPLRYHICSLLRHHPANVGPAITRSAGPVPPALIPAEQENTLTMLESMYAYSYICMCKWVKISRFPYLMSHSNHECIRTHDLDQEPRDPTILNIWSSNWLCVLCSEFNDIHLPLI